jgi:hypothetical protein
LQLVTPALLGLRKRVLDATSVVGNKREVESKHSAVSKLHVKWSAPEEQTLIDAHPRLGSNWSAYATLLPTRTTPALERHWWQLQRDGVVNRSARATTSSVRSSNQSVVPSPALTRGDSESDAAGSNDDDNAFVIVSEDENDFDNNNDVQDDEDRVPLTRWSAAETQTLMTMQRRGWSDIDIASRLPGRSFKAVSAMISKLEWSGLLRRSQA